MITHKSLQMIKDKEGNHMEEIEEVLSKDSRYNIMDPLNDDRADILMSYLEELERHGPPLPPTASEPSCLLCTNTVYSSSVLCLQHLRAPRCDPIKLKTGVTVQPTHFKSGPLKTIFDINTKTATSLHFSHLTSFRMARCGHQRMHKLQKRSVKHNDNNMGM